MGFQSDDGEGNSVDDYDTSNNKSNVTVFVSMEDELKQALDENNASDDDSVQNTELINNMSSNLQKPPVRKDSISIEELEEIINESSSSDSELDFSDDEENEPEEETLTKDKKTAPLHTNIKRQLSTGLLSSDIIDSLGSSTSPKRFRSSSDASSSADNENSDSFRHKVAEPNLLPPLPWLSLGPPNENIENTDQPQSYLYLLVLEKK